MNLTILSFEKGVHRDTWFLYKNIVSRDGNQLYLVFDSEIYERNVKRGNIKDIAKKYGQPFLVYNRSLNVTIAISKREINQSFKNLENLYV